MYAEGSIAGVAQEVGGDDLRMEIIDGGAFLPSRTVSHRIAADRQTVYTQTTARGAGRRFGVRQVFCPIDLLADTIAAINAAVEAGSSFTVALSDNLHDISEACLPDGTDFVSYDAGRLSGEQVSNVVYRFITAG